MQYVSYIVYTCSQTRQFLCDFLTPPKTISKQPSPTSYPRAPHHSEFSKNINLLGEFISPRKIYEHELFIGCIGTDDTLSDVYAPPFTPPPSLPHTPPRAGAPTGPSGSPRGACPLSANHPQALLLPLAPGRHPTQKVGESIR